MSNFYKVCLYLGVIISVHFGSIAQSIKRDSTKKDTSRIANIVTVASATNLNLLLPQLTPKSPNVSALGRYGQYPVNLNTGLPNIEIPIFDIEVKGIRLPIKLSYHASGNKVTDAASFVGLGWALQYGGSVNRQLRSLADEVNAGLLGKTVPVDIQASQGAICYNEDVRSYYQGLSENTKDAERDIFSLNIPSKSNQFILRDTTNYQWISPEPTKVQFSRATNSLNSNSVFTITDEGGNQYSFGETEVTNGVGISSWLLTQIQGTRPQDRIILQYNTADSYSRTHDIMESVTLNDNPTGTPPSGITWATPGSTPTVNLVSVSNYVEQKLPKTIHFPSGKIEFVLETTDRQDGLGKALDKIQVYGYNTASLSYHLIKTYDLTYVYKNRTDNSPVLFLNEVLLLDSLGTQIGKYQLGYESTALPAVQSKARDYWGYYNGATGNSTLIPSQNVAVSFQNNSGTVGIGGGNRLANEDYMKAWVLNKITYPTGGYSQFKYEANRYLNGSTLTQAGGLRIVSITSTADNTTPSVTKSYRYGVNGNGAGTLSQSLTLQYSTEQKVLNCQSNTTGSPCATIYTYRVRTYTSNASGALFPHEGSPVTYPEVTEYEDSLASGRNGKTVYQYREASDNQITLNRGAKFFVNSKHWNRGQLLNKLVYGRDLKLKSKLNNTYQVMGAGTTTDLCGRLVQTQSIYEGNRNLYAVGSSLCYSDIDDYQPSQTYFFEYGRAELVKSEEYLYDNTDDTKYTLKMTYTDYVPTYYFPRLSRTVVNAGEIRAKKFYYPFDYNTIPSSTTGELFSIRRLIEKNQINAPIEEISYYKSSLTATDSLISGAKLTTPFSKEDNSSGTYKSLFVATNKIYLLESQFYNAFGTSPYQSSADLYNASPNSYTSNLPKHSLYDLKLTMDSYDFYGNLNSYSIANGRTDALYYQDYSHDGVRLSTLTGQTQDYGGLNHTTNYAYTTPLLGLSSIKSPNGVYSYFTYDSFGRLKTISDHNKKVLKEYAYDYTNRSVTEWQAREELSSVSASTTSANAIKIVNFVDGLGRDLQKVIANGSPDATKDIISSHVLYDTVGRAYKNYLASPSSLGSGSLLSLTNLQSSAATFYSDTKPFTEITAFDNSPLNRAITNFGAGNAWRTANKSIDVAYQVAPANTIKRFKASLSAVFCNVEGQATTIDYYGANELEKKVTTSERGKKVTEYIDLQGRLVQKEIEVSSDTVLTVAFCYDLYDRLAYAIQPKTYKLFTSARAYIFDTENDSKEGIFVYKYDRKGQLIQSRVAGYSDFEIMVYDRQYRLVLSRDVQDDQVLDTYGRSRFKFTKYDALNRPVMSGLTFLTQGFDRQTLQNDFDAQPSNLVNEVRSSQGGLLGYANTSFPVNYTPSDMNVRKVYYYDNYNWQTDALLNFDASKSFGTRWTDSFAGINTGELSRNLNTNAWQKRVAYQDFKGRIIQDFYRSNRNNLIRKDYQYRFNGELLKTRIEKKNSSNVLLSTKMLSYEYDHLGRKISYGHSGKPIAKYSYDGIGRLITKKFAPSGTTQSSKQTGNWTDISTWLSGTLPTLADNVTINTGQVITIPTTEQAFAGILNDKGTLKNLGTLNMGKATTADLYTQTLSYHIRGGLKGINLDASDNLTNNLFSYKISRENANYYDGNIGKQEWKSSIDNITRSNTFRYDGASQIKASVFASSKSGENYSLNNVNYDDNGNIVALSRSGATNAGFTSFGNVDNLTYVYQSNSNKLLRVTDATTSNVDLGDFRNGTNSDDDYGYWADGSLSKDKNKGIDSIKYNYLKLVERVKFSSGRSINYEYDASGVKLKKIDSNGETTEYEEDDIYVNGVLYQTSHDEGRIVNGVYEYNITDHNNDLRIAFKDSAGIATPTQSIFYDAWGLSMKGMQITRNPANFNKFQFLNRETQFETGYIDLIHRQFDPQTGRFTSQDPIIAGQEHLSLYQYGWNNPILKPDPDGRCPKCEAAVKNPTDGQTFSTTGATYTYSGGQWARNGGQLNEVIVRPEGAYAEPAVAYTTATKGVVAGYSAGYTGSGEYGSVEANVTGFRAEYNNATGTVGSANLALDGGVKITGLQGTTSLRGGTENNNIGVGAEGNVLLAEAKATFGILTGENSKKGAFIGGEVGAYALKGEVNPSVTFLGYKFGFTTGASLASAHIGAGFGYYRDSSKGTFILKGSYNIGFGAGIKFGFDIEKSVK